MSGRGPRLSGQVTGIKRKGDAAHLKRRALATYKSRMSVNKRVRRLEQVNKFQGSLRKYKESFVTAAAVTTAAPLLIYGPSIGPGTGQTTRIGNEVYFQTGALTMDLRVPSRTSNFQPTNVRIMAGIIKHGANNGGTILTATNVLNGIFGTTATGYAFAQYQPKVGSDTGDGLGTKYIVKYDKIFREGKGVYHDATGGFSYTMPVSKLIRVMLNFKNLKAEWPGDIFATTAPPDVNCPFFLIFTDNGNCTLDYQYRQWFTEHAVV